MGGEELVDLVDSDDRVVGRASLRECLEGGLKHRAVAVLVLRSNGALLLQQRSLNDVWHPGRWTLSSTGHVRAGEGYDMGAERELEEELGLSSKLAFLAKVHLPKVRSRGLVEWEVVSLYTTSTDAPTKIDPSEVNRVEERSVADVRRMMKGRALTPDSKRLLAVYLDSIRGRHASRLSPRAHRLRRREKR